MRFPPTSPRRAFFSLVIGHLTLVIAAHLASAQAPSIPVRDPIAEGQALRAEILAQTPAANSQSTGVLRHRDRQGRRTETPVRFQMTVLTPTSWMTSYTAAGEQLTVNHQQARANHYTLARAATPGGDFGQPAPLDQDTQIYKSFAGSEFWPADLGLEFFHWPAQRLLKKEMRKGRSCRVLESLHPAPLPGAYARVLSWVDLETNGLVLAEAYDAAGKLMKEFSVRSFKKIDGVWQLKEMEIRNPQTEARTSLIFDLTSD